MNIFITGATGFIGKQVVELLTAALGPDDRIYALVRHSENFRDHRIAPLIGDLAAIERHREALLDSDYVFHLAANATFGDAADYDAVNYFPTAAIVDILRQSSRIRNFLFLSTIGAIDRSADDSCAAPLHIGSKPSPTSKYGRSKLKAEQYIVASGIPYTIIRPTWVYGRDMRANSHINKFVTLVHQMHPIVHFHLPGKVSLIHVADLARAITNTIDNPRVANKTYFAETEALSLGSILSIIYRRVHQKAPVQLPLPRFQQIIGKVHSKLPLTIANLFVDYLTARDDSFRSDFHLETVTPFDTGIDDVIATNVYQGYWVITGANSGIGYELALQLHAMGKKLVLIDRKTDQLSAFSAQIVVTADLAKSGDRERAADQIGSRTIFCLINNAGIGARGSIGDLDAGTIQRIIDVNVCYPLLFTKLLLGSLVRQGSMIVNMASSIAYNPLPHMSVYSASKAFLANWSESLTYELRGTNRVITVSPAGTFTNFQKSAGVKVLHEGRGLLTPSLVAKRIIDTVLHSDKNILFIGLSSRVLLMLSRLLPRKWNILVWGKLFENLR